MSSVGTRARTFTLALAGASTYLELPLPTKGVIRGLTFKSKTPEVITYRYDGSGAVVTLEKGDVYNERGIALRPGSKVYVAGPATDTIDGEYWV